MLAIQRAIEESITTGNLSEDIIVSAHNVAIANNGRFVH